MCSTSASGSYVNDAHISDSSDSDDEDESDFYNNKTTSISGLDKIGQQAWGNNRDMNFRNSQVHDDIDTRLFENMANRLVYSYTNVPWTLHLKKEVFSPGETLEELVVVDLIFMQIMKDYNSSAESSCSIRMAEKDRNQLTNLLGNFNF